jgi:hypothetical protein
MLNLFTMKDNKVGVTFWDAIRIAFAGLFTFILFEIGALFVGLWSIKRRIKELESEVRANEGTPVMRRPHIDKVLRIEYGRSWEKLLTAQLKYDVYTWLNRVLKCSLEIKRGMGEQQANNEFNIDLRRETVKKISGGDVKNIALSPDYWRYLLKKSFPWLWCSWGGWDSTRNGKIVATNDKEQTEYELQQYLQSIKPLMYERDNLFEVEQTWFFDNHKAMINSVLKELLIEHPEYKSVCPSKIC